MKVSVLSAVHNEESYLPEMIRSLLHQSHEDWEAIFVSDGSTDATEELIVKAAAAEPRIRLVGEGAKIGKVAAFNAAFNNSAGDVVVLLAGDDTLPEDSLETRCRALRGVDCHTDLVVAFFKLRTMSGNRKHDGLILPRGAAASHSGGQYP